MLSTATLFDVPNNPHQLALVPCFGGDHETFHLLAAIGDLMNFRSLQLRL